MWNGEKAGYQHFLLFSQCLIPIAKRIYVLKLHLFCLQQMVWNWTSLKFVVWSRAKFVCILPPSFLTFDCYWPLSPHCEILNFNEPEEEALLDRKKILVISISTFTPPPPPPPVFSKAFFFTVDWVMFYAVFNSISVISRRQHTSFMAFLGFTSTRLGLWSVLPKDTPTKNSADPVRLELRIPRLQVKHFTTEPLRTPPPFPI